MSESKYRALLVEFVDLLSKRDMPGEQALLGLSNRIEAALAEPPVRAEPVGSLHISHFRDNPAMENVDFQLIADLKPGSYQLYLHPPAAQPPVLVEALEHILKMHYAGLSRWATRLQTKPEQHWPSTRRKCDGRNYLRI